MSLTNLCSCILMKDQKMRQIINDIYLLFLRIMNLTSFILRKIIFIIFFKNLRLYPSPPLQKSSKRFLISIFFPSGEGGHPPPPLDPPCSTPRHFVPLTRVSPLFTTIHPPPPFHQIMEYRVTIWHFERRPE